MSSLLLDWITTSIFALIMHDSWMCRGLKTGSKVGCTFDLPVCDTRINGELDHPPCVCRFQARYT